MDMAQLARLMRDWAETHGPAPAHKVQEWATVIENACKTVDLGDQRETPLAPQQVVMALARIAGIKADDGDTFSEYDDRTVLRVEMIAGDLRAVREALPAAGLMCEALRVLRDFALDISEGGDDEERELAHQVLGMVAVRLLTHNEPPAGEGEKG